MSEPSVDESKLEELLGYCVSNGKKKLAEAGKFKPFGAAVTKDDRVIAFGAPDDEETPSGGELAAAMVEEFHNEFESGEIIAAALAADVVVPEKFEPEYNDGIRISLECEGYSRHFFLPYQIEGDQVSYGSMFAVEVESWLLTG